MAKIDIKIKQKVEESMAKQIQARGYSTHIDVLLDMNVLTKNDYERFRKGEVRYLEQVCHKNLRQLTVISKCIRSYANENQLKPSFAKYKPFKNARRKELQFSKSNDPKIERQYQTHYVDSDRIKELKDKKNS